MLKYYYDALILMNEIDPCGILVSIIDNEAELLVVKKLIELHYVDLCVSTIKKKIFEYL